MYTTFITVLDYSANSANAVRQYSVTTEQQWPDNDWIESWLAAHTFYNDATCYYMTSITETTLQKFSSNIGERDI